MKTILYFLTMWLLIIPAPAVLAADTAPDALVKSTVDEVMAVIKQNKDKQALRALAEQKVLPYFDFKHMTQLAVGTAWRQANPAQQQALETGFRTLLVNTYTTALSVFGTGTQTVEVKPAQVKADQNEVTVKTMVKDPGKQPSLHQTGRPVSHSSQYRNAPVAFILRDLV